MVEKISISELTGHGMATIMARKDVGAEAIGTVLGIALQSAPRMAGSSAFKILGTGPGTWLAIDGSYRPAWHGELADKLSGLASVSEQTSGYSLFRLSGPGARKALQRGVAIDLHDDSFGAGAVATTMIAHIGVIMWRPDDSPAYEIAVFRSFSESFRHWLSQTAAAL